MTLTEIQRTLSQAQGQAASIAANHNDGELRILAIAIAETARAVHALADNLDQATPSRSGRRVY